LAKKDVLSEEKIDRDVLSSLEERTYDDSQKKYAVDNLRSRLNDIVQTIDNNYKINNVMEGY
jgi:hypothetical protein